MIRGGLGLLLVDETGGIEWRVVVLGIFTVVSSSTLGGGFFRPKEKEQRERE